MPQSQWYYAQGGRQQGPVPWDELKRLAADGRLRPGDLVWTDGEGDWKAASEVVGLFDAAAPGEPPPAPGPGGAASDELIYPHQPPRDPTLMAILSIVPGLGQIILGQTVKGIVLLVAAVAIFTSTRLGGAAVMIAAIIDAQRIGTKLKNDRPVRPWEFF